MEILTPRNNKNRKFLLKILIFIFFCGNLYSQNYPYGKKETGEKLYVVKNGAILRTEPTLYGFEVSLLSQGEEVQVLFKTQKEEIIGETKSIWYYVKTEKGLVGWIFGALLSKTKTKKEEYYFDPKLVSNILEGLWWEVNERGETGFRSLEFQKENQDSLEGTVIYKFQNTNPIEVKFKITEKGMIQLEKALPIGKEIYVFESYEYRIYFLNDNKKQIMFKKSQVPKEELEKKDEQQ